MPGWVRVLLVVLGILAVVAGIVYLVEPVHSLPSFFPGHAHGNVHHHIRGYIAIAVGAVLILIAAFAGRSRRRREAWD